ncbi:LOW QUALITY PROTEIN: cytochrome P450 [Colletotrichum lupini]|nr:LOW QUALITY PROTEIN: cytochrome P450 [Colletotrichum lupini]
MLSFLLSAGLFCLVITSWLVIVTILRAVYNFIFYLLVRYLGPRLVAITRLVYVYYFVNGDAVGWLDKLHVEYGDVVRVEPGRLSYIIPQAWKDIYGYATAIRKVNSKERKNSKNLFSNGSYSISSAHVCRKISSEKNSPGAAVMDLFNFATFDIMADLAFGEALGCLENGGSNAWVDAAAAVHVQSSHERVTKRLAKGADARNDIWGLVLKAEGPNALTRTEMNNNANNFMIVGTETSATALSALTYFLLKSLRKLERLVRELKGDVLKDLPYLQACLTECLRLYPPVPTGGMRVIGEGGNTILGHLLPEDTKMSIATWTAFRIPRYWKDGNEFIPERWILGERGVFQVFGTGPRACIGKNLALQEMRLLYATFLFYFDMELCPESDRWMED